MERKLSLSFHIIEVGLVVQLHENFEVFSLKNLYEVMKGANRILPDRLDRDSQLKGVLGREL